MTSLKEKNTQKSDVKAKLEQDKEDFDLIYKDYPKKRGKAKAFEYYRGYVGQGRVINGTRYRLDRRQIYLAMMSYVEEKRRDGIDIQFYQNFDTFMNKTVLDYLPVEENA